MKFGVIAHKDTQNIGDDIQTYAAARLLPKVSYYIDREYIDDFKTDDGKPAAVVMTAWYMWHKWNWPPSKYVVPLLTGMHYSDHQVSKQFGSPVKYEFISGCGRDYMNAHGPVGCRDNSTLKAFKERGVDCFFSGCITLTLPKMEIRKPEREYICAVDLPADVYAKLEEILSGTDIELKKITHYLDYRESEATWEERKQAVIEQLTLYQNAKCVVSRRLHCVLPCLAMEVPVLAMNSKNPLVANRFEPYYDMLNFCTYKDFVAGKCDYDFTDPPPNPQEYLKYRNGMMQSIADFVEKYRDEDGDPDDYVKTSYTEDELIRWRHDVMKECMNTWLEVTQKEEKQIKDLREKCKKKDARLRELVNCKTVKLAVKARNAVLPEEKRIHLENLGDPKEPANPENTGTPKNP